MPSVAVKKTICNTLKVVTFLGCFIGFIMNSLAIIFTYQQGATTVNTQRHLAIEGLKPPSVTICPKFKFDHELENRTFSLEDVIKSISVLERGKLRPAEHIKLDALYVRTRGLCFMITFGNNVSPSCQIYVTNSRFN